MTDNVNLPLEQRGMKVRGNTISGNDPSLPSTAPKSSLSRHSAATEKSTPKFISYFYNRDTKEYCGRTCKSWAYIVGYAIIYLLFLTTYTLIILYVSLFILKSVTNFEQEDVSKLTYPKSGVGLTATPTSETIYPLIWYKHGEKDDYNRYVRAIDKFLSTDKNNKNTQNLGPCGKSPYGYGENPCVIIRVNKHFHWAGKPLQQNSTVTSFVAPEVKKWMKADNNRLWLQCNGYHAYDREHIGSIKYYPDPPGVNPNVFPLKKEDVSPLVAIQISNFTIGISLAVECKLWYETGPSSVHFVLYVAPNDTTLFTGQGNVRV